MDTPQHDPKDVAENKDLAALSYVWVLSLVVLLARRNSAFAQFHARQGVALFVLSLVVWAMPFVGKLAELLILALCVIGFLHAAQGQWRELPVIGPLSCGSWSDLRGSWREVVAAAAALWNRVRRTHAAKNAAPDPAQPQPASSPLPVIDVTPEPPAPSSEPPPSPPQP